MTLPGFPDAAPEAGLAGGVLIGLAAAIMLLGAGRIAGISGIAARAAGLSQSTMARGSAWAFLLGLPVGAVIVSAIQGGLQASFASPALLVIAGLFVGFGTKIGSGCTSGHGADDGAPDNGLLFLVVEHRCSCHQAPNIFAGSWVRHYPDGTDGFTCGCAACCHGLCKQFSS